MNTTIYSVFNFVHCKNSVVKHIFTDEVAHRAFTSTSTSVILQNPSGTLYKWSAGTEFT